MKASMNSLLRGPLAALFGLVVLLACVSFSRPAYADHLRVDDAPIVGGHEFEVWLEGEHVVIFEDFKDKFKSDDSESTDDSDFGKKIFPESKNHDWDKDKKDKKLKFDDDGKDGDAGGIAGGTGGDPPSVPDPSSMVLLSTALLGLAVAGRRKLF